MKLNVVIVDDNKDMLRGPTKILAGMGKLNLGDEQLALETHPIWVRRNQNRSLDIEALARGISRLQPGVAIIDMRLEGDEPDDLSGVDLSLRVRALCPDCCIILVSAFFGDTPQLELFKHLEVFRSLVSRGGDLHGSKFQSQLELTVTEACLAYASTVNYRRHRFAATVNNGRKKMWGLVLKPRGRVKSQPPYLSVVKDLPIPYLRGNSVVVKLLEVGVCGTNRASLGSPPPPDYSLIDFHEAFGRVVWTGEEVQNIRVNDYVVPMVRRCDPWDSPPSGTGIEPSSFGFKRCDDASNCVSYPRADQCPVGEYREKTEGSRSSYRSHGADSRHFVDIEEWLIRVEPPKRGYKSRGTGKCHGFGSQYFIDTEEWLIRVELPEAENLRSRMMKRYVLTEPLSVVWKVHREIIKHRAIREYSDRALIIGLGPIGLLTATVMSKHHPGLSYTAMDLASANSRRVKLLENHFHGFRFVHAAKANAVPKELKRESFDLIIDATDQPDKVFEYAPSLLAPGGILVLVGISDEIGIVETTSEAITDVVKRGNILIGSINSSRSDYEESIAFMGRVIGDEDSILEDVTDPAKGMVNRWRIDDDLPKRLVDLGRTKPWKRDEIKVVLKAGE